MQLTKFKYVGAEPKTVSLKETGDTQLQPGKTISLPAENMYIRSLVATGELVAEPPKAANNKQSTKNLHHGS